MNKLLLTAPPGCLLSGCMSMVTATTACKDAFDNMQNDTGAGEPAAGG